ncbi:MAG TPA: FGGY-family carbohydrate kinase, partial [Candidatus Sphingobacterium stercoripullorum]|nr:FGGY-family carbohydrate kinase [Candidatus Sphingobacterium stercoripullorum]
LSEHREIALDWLNGRRTPDANQWLKSAVIGLNLSTRPEHIYQALVEAACFGAKAIVDRFIEEGILVKGLIALGGIPKKSPYIMQTMADVAGMSIKVHSSEQTCALGAAMFAATAAGVYDNVEEAMKRMGQGFESEYVPNPDKHQFFLKRYRKYQQLGSFIETEMTK